MGPKVTELHGQNIELKGQEMQSPETRQPIIYYPNCSV